MEHQCFIRCDGTVAFLEPRALIEEAIEYLADESKAWEEPSTWRQMTDAEINRYRESVRLGNGNPFGPEDF